MKETIPNYTVGFENTQTTTAYIPTVFVLPPELKVGENWYVKFPEGNNTLIASEILDVTEKTVKIKSGCLAPVRYKKTDIEFVEKVQ